MITFLLRKNNSQIPLNSQQENQDMLPLTFVTIPSKPNKTTLVTTLTNSTVTITTQAEPCPFCNKFQCVFDYSHEVYFTVKAACDETLDQLWKMKPPDDPSG